MESAMLSAGARSLSRLSSSTRALAEQALAGEHGRAMQNADFSLDPRQAERMLPATRYAETIRLIARRAPLRYVPGERLMGSATLLEATRHMTPASEFPSTSHTTIGFERALNEGLLSYERRIRARMKRGGLDGRGQRLLEAMLTCVDAMRIWRERNLEHIRALGSELHGLDRETCEEVVRIADGVADRPPASFHEGVQALWFLWEFQRLCGNWSGIGRIDKMLGPLLRHDLRHGVVSLDGARDILAHFWVKGAEWIGAPSHGSGDAQFYQNIVLSGVDEHGTDVTNEVTYLVLDIVEQLHISDFPVAVRIGKRTPDRLLRRIAEVQRCGGGIVSIYNEDVVVPTLQRFGFPAKEARNFTNDGCWEVLVPGKTAFGYKAFDVLQILQAVLGLEENGEIPVCSDFEALYARFESGFARRLEKIQAEIDEIDKDPARPVKRGAPAKAPAVLLSIFVDDCIERARGYKDGGPVYRVAAPHAGGLPDTANSLLMIKRLVYDERRFAMSELVQLLRSNWCGAEALRKEIMTRYELYGNDDDEADAMMTRVFDTYVELGSRVQRRKGVLRPLGISTFGREVGWRHKRMATAHGRKAGDILASNLSPTPGSDRKGPTAAIRSFCKMDFGRLPNGVPLDLKILPQSVAGEKGLMTIVALLKSFVNLRGWYLQMDVVDTAVLRDAQKHPERYANLAVRVSGWSARFTTLNSEWQELIINRTEHEVAGHGR